jgi:hypothetical protein
VATTSQHGGLLANRVYASISLPPTVLRLPKRTKGPLVKGVAGVTAFDVARTPDGHYVAGGEDGQAHIGRLHGGYKAEIEADGMQGDDIEARAQRRIQLKLAEHAAKTKVTLTGHVGDVRSARFFPSGQGEDRCDDGRCERGLIVELSPCSDPDDVIRLHCQDLWSRRQQSTDAERP